MQLKLIFHFNKQADISAWQVTDDVVMGGISNGIFSLCPEGFGVFEGRVSLENNGGFSMVRYRFAPLHTEGYKKIRIRLKGDGKRYQLRIKDRIENKHSYVNYFETDGTWQEIEIPLNNMYPTFRGRKLDLPNFGNEQIEEAGFLIGNKKAEKFKLLIDTIGLYR